MTAPLWRMAKQALLLLLLVALFPISVLAAGAEMGIVRGKIGTPENLPCRGVVSFWDGSAGRTPDPRRYVIIPFSAVNLQSSCEFEVQAPAGSYYVGALLRNTPGPDLGPPRPGDIVFMTPDPEGGSVKIDLGPGQTVDIGVHQAGWRYEGMLPEASMGITGIVRDSTGRPIPGVLVFAFADAEMTRNPLAVSARTDPEGRYLLRIDRPGQVYLRVKEHYGGGAPIEGGYVGVFGGGKPRMVEISEKSLVEGVDIEVFNVPAGRTGSRDGGPPGGRGGMK